MGPAPNQIELSNEADFEQQYENIIADLTEKRGRYKHVLVIAVEEDLTHIGHVLGNPELLGELALNAGELLITELTPSQTNSDETSPIILLN